MGCQTPPRRRKGQIRPKLDSQAQAGSPPRERIASSPQLASHSGYSPSAPRDITGLLGLKAWSLRPVAEVLFLGVLRLFGAVEAPKLPQAQIFLAGRVQIIGHNHILCCCALFA